MDQETKFICLLFPRTHLSFKNRVKEWGKVLQSDRIRRQIGITIPSYLKGPTLEKKKKQEEHKQVT